MKLRNKKTGEIREIKNILVDGMFTVNSLSELNEEWEDYEEPKVGYIIDPMEEDYVSADDSGYEEADIERAKELGIWLETKEEAEKAVEKLKAWQRLKDKGFEFRGWTFDDGLRVSICTNIDSEGIYDDDKKDLKKDLDLLFGGEE